MSALPALAAESGMVRACTALGLSRATLHRHRSPKLRVVSTRTPPLKLSDVEQTTVIDELMSDRFVDRAPHQVYATLLDEGRFLCSIRTMYRLLAARQAVRERRDQRVHPSYARPELMATAPGQLWSWDITKLPGPTKGCYYDAYVMIDIYTRYIVGVYVHTTESGLLAEEMMKHIFGIHGIPKVVHADLGTSMTSKTVAALLGDLGVTRSHSRPHVSNDNPYSEAWFKTLKVRPALPGAIRLAWSVPAFSDASIRLPVR